VPSLSTLARPTHSPSCSTVNAVLDAERLDELRVRRFIAGLRKHAELGLPRSSRALAASCKPRRRPSWQRAFFSTLESAVSTSMGGESAAGAATSSPASSVWWVPPRQPWFALILTNLGMGRGHVRSWRHRERARFTGTLWRQPGHGEMAERVACLCPVRCGVRNAEWCMRKLLSRGACH